MEGQGRKGGKRVKVCVWHKRACFVTATPSRGESSLAHTAFLPGGLPSTFPFWPPAPSPLSLPCSQAGPADLELQKQVQFPAQPGCEPGQVAGPLWACFMCRAEDRQRTPCRLWDWVECSAQSRPWDRPGGSLRRCALLPSLRGGLPLAWRGFTWVPLPGRTAQSGG